MLGDFAAGITSKTCERKLKVMFWFVSLPQTCFGVVHFSAPANFVFDGKMKSLTLQLFSFWWLLSITGEELFFFLIQ
jgi:hypothetical protein